MLRFPLDEQKHGALWLDACRRARNLDRFCSSPYWGVSLCEAFQPQGKLFLYQGESDSSLGLFVERTVKGGCLVMPPDAMWLLGCPLLSDNPGMLFRELLHYWHTRPLREGIRQVMISGLYPESSLLATRFWERLGGWEVDSSQRMVASLRDGFDGYMSRRSRNFRSRLRRMVKASEAAGYEVEFMPYQAEPEKAESLMHRVFAIEEASWKGQAGRGINDGGMQAFYLAMVPRLASQGLLRGLFLTRDGRDAAYLFGGMLDETFRGLQFSFSHDQKLGLGNVCQYHMLCRLCEEGVLRYDLGQGMEYKKRWAEEHIESRSFVFQI